MVAVKGKGCGGARPGAGRKNAATREAQLTNRQIFLDAVSEQDIADVTIAMVEKAKGGDERAFRAIAAYVLGSPEAELTVKGDAAAPLRVEVVYVDGEPEDLAA